MIELSEMDFSNFEVLPQLLKGAAVTIEITLMTAALALVLSFVVGLLRLAQNAWVRRITFAWVELWRGTSAVVQLFFMFYVLPGFGVSLSPILTAVVCLGFNISAYGSEIVRSSILAVSPGQHEAAATLGLSKTQTYRFVILPQALVAMMPSFGNLLIDLVKGTSLVSLITITELTFSGRQMIVSTGNSATVWVLVLFLYFAIAYPLSLAVRGAERHAARFRR